MWLSSVVFLPGRERLFLFKRSSTGVTGFHILISFQFSEVPALKVGIGFLLKVQESLPLMVSLIITEKAPVAELHSEACVSPGICAWFYSQSSSQRHSEPGPIRRNDAF